MIRKLLEGKVPPEILNEIPNGYEKIGKAIIIFSNRDYGKYNKVIGTEILKHIPDTESVFLKISKTEGIERVYKVKLIAGKNKSIFLHKENGSVFLVNIRKTFFSPTLQNIRKTIAEETKESDIVLDMFAGVGPFSIQMAKKAKLVYAIEINKYAYQSLKRNIKLNKVNNVIPILGDANEIVRKMEERFDKIVMNLPTEAENFLSLALSHLNTGGIVYLFKFVNYYGYEKERKIREEIEKIKNSYNIIKDISVLSSGESAPYTSRVCFRIAT